MSSDLCSPHIKRISYVFFKVNDFSIGTLFLIGIEVHSLAITSSWYLSCFKKCIETSSGVESKPVNNE